MSCLNASKDDLYNKTGRLESLKRAIELTELKAPEEAFLQLQQLIADSPHSEEACKAHYLSIGLCERSGDHLSAKFHRNQLLAHFKEHPLTEEVIILQDHSSKASFSEHLKEMEQLYPNSPYLALLWYRDALTELGNRNWRQAADQLERAQKRISSSPLADQLLEELQCKRVETLLNWSEESKGAKRSCNLKLAEEALTQVVAPDQRRLLLARLHHLRGQRELAKQLLEEQIEESLNLQLTKSFDLARAYQLQSAVASAEGATELAIERLRLAAAAAPRGALQLDLLMELSGLLDQNEQYEAAIHALSSVINAPLISPLRAEALQRRAELWEIMGRDDLAKLQRGDDEFNPTSINQ